MTFEGIVKQYAEAVYATGVVSKSMGLAQISSVSTPTGSGTIVTGEVYPFATGKRETISPDSKESGISFFRASAMQITKQSAFLNEMRTQITLTVWINGNKVKSNGEQDIQMMIADTVRKYQLTIPDGSQYRTIQLRLGNITNEGITGYGWDGLQFKYHEAPHQLFNIQFEFLAWVGSGCATPTFQIAGATC